MPLLEELKQRNVVRVGTAYVVTAWLLLQVAETVLPAFGFTATAMRYLIIALVIGFVTAVVAAWFFELTPDGIRRDGDAQRDRADAVKRARRFDRGIVIILLIGIAYFAFDKFVLAPQRAVEREAQVAAETAAEVRKGFYGDRSIAVLPFDNLSADEEQVYFVDGVAEEILNLLARIRDLRVISRSSSFALRDRDLDIPAIGRMLDVGHVLEGSVRRSGNRVRVTAQLIEARTDTHLWSRTYERELDDVFRIQDEIALDVVRNLEIRLQRPLPHSRNVNPEAYALVQQVSQIFQTRPEDAAERMYLLATRAYELDPDYPDAVRWLSISEWMRGYYGLVSEEEARANWEPLEARYAELAPESGYPEAGQGFDMELAGELEKAAELFLKSLEKDLTNSEQLRLAGRFAFLIGKHDVAVRILQLAVAIDPLSHQGRRHLSQALMYRGLPGDYRRGLELREQYLASARGGQPHYSELLMLNGRAEKVAEVWSPLADSDNYQAISYIAMADYAMGNTAEAQRKLQQLEMRYQSMFAADADSSELEQFAYQVAYTAAWLGDADTAFEYLMPPPDPVPHQVRMEFFSAAWRAIQNDPRWTEYREAIGMSQVRLDAIEFDPWLPE